MARHLRNQFKYHVRPGTVDISGYFTVVAGTPVTVSVTDCPGVTSVTRSDTGNFTINLDEAALDVVGFKGMHLPASGAILQVIPSTLAPATRKTEALASTLKFDMRTAAAGSETDPTATDQIWVEFTLVRSLAGQR